MKHGCIFWLLLWSCALAAQGNVEPGHASEGVIEVPSEAVHGLIVRKVAPIYPPLARQARIEGTVVLSIVINQAGEVRETKLVSGHPILAPAAIEAVKQWRYRPYISGDLPVDVQTIVRVNFRIADTRAGSRSPEIAVPGPSPMGLADRVRVSAGVMEGLLANKVDAEYPTDAKEQRVQGTVVLTADIDEEGNVTRVELVSGHPLLAPAAMDAVLQWTYRPLALNGQPVAVETTVQVNFVLQQ